MSRYSSHDPYLDPASGVLKNRFGITTAARAIFTQLANDKRLAGLDAAAFSARAGYYLGEINALHPFREGNGRAQREFISHLAYKNGYDIAWQHVTEKKMTQASITAFNGDPTQLATLIERNLRPLHREATAPKRARKTKPPFPKP